MSETRPSMPLLLRVVMIGGVAFGVLSALAGSFMLAMLWLQPIPGPYFVNGARVSRGEFLGYMLPGVAAYLVFAVMALATSWGLYRRRPWARGLLLTLGAGMTGASILGAYLLGVDFGKVAAPMIGSVLTVAFLWWRLYHDDDVLAYYDRIEEEARERS